jgi:hypothetical protein
VSLVYAAAARLAKLLEQSKSADELQSVLEHLKLALQATTANAAAPETSTSVSSASSSSSDKTAATAASSASESSVTVVLKDDDCERLLDLIDADDAELRGPLQRCLEHMQHLRR